MLPSERSEILVRRLGLTVLVLMALGIAVWVARLVSRTSHRLLEQRAIPVEEGRVPAGLFG